MERALGKYALEVADLAGSETTREETYYPAVRSLLISLLEAQGLPFQVRSNTSEKRSGGGTDLPDVALYDGEGDYLAVCGEVKLPNRDLEEMAASTEGGDQVGRYLAQTRVVILSNIRGFALLVAKPGAPDGPVGPKHRRLEHVVELWPFVSALRQAKPVAPGVAEQLTELVETAVTRLAPISEPLTGQDPRPPGAPS